MERRAAFVGWRISNVLTSRIVMDALEALCEERQVAAVLDVRPDGERVTPVALQLLPGFIWREIYHRDRQYRARSWPLAVS